MQLISGNVFYLCKIFLGIQCAEGARSYLSAVTAASKCSWGILAAPRGARCYCLHETEGEGLSGSRVCWGSHSKEWNSTGGRIWVVWDWRHGASTALSTHPAPGAHGWSSASMLTLRCFTLWLFWVLVHITCLHGGFGGAWEKPQCENKEKSWQALGGQRLPVTVVHQW